jgi:tetratricopeptide (TPR) repeat protein
VRVVPLLLAGTWLLASAAWATDPCSSSDTNQQATNAQNLVKQKKFQPAEAPARAALSACPTHAVAAWALGGSLIGQQKYADAIAAMSSVIAAKVDVAYAYLWRGQAYYSLKQADKAVVDFQSFLKLAPNAPEAATVKQILAGLGR